MDPLEEKVVQVVRSRLAGDADLEKLPDGRFIGHVISPRFDDIDYEQRRNLLWSVLKADLAPQEYPQVSMLLTYTPEEWNVTL